MGMAASQARLLSITTRLSDNELRSQLINNAKMRLATESSSVSEAYIAALNDTTYMFTNYDSDNNTTYSTLTFNSLTAYNEFNTQYGLSNAAGQILVSETDGANFEKSSDLTSFLACYGLEYRTTYFETLAETAGGTEAIPTVYDDDYVCYQSLFTVEELEDFYSNSYDTVLMSSAFNNYLSLEETYIDAREAYNDALGDYAQDVLDAQTSDSYTISSISEYISDYDSTDTTYSASSMAAYASALYNIACGLAETYDFTSSDFMTQMKKYNEYISSLAATDDNGKYTTESVDDELDLEQEDGDNDGWYIYLDDTVRLLYSEGALTLQHYSEETDDEGNVTSSSWTNYTSYTDTETDDDGNTTSTTYELANDSDGIYTLSAGGDKYTLEIEKIDEAIDAANEAESSETTFACTLTPSDSTRNELIYDTLLEMYNYFNNNIEDKITYSESIAGWLEKYDEAISATDATTYASKYSLSSSLYNAYTAYVEASEAMIEYIFKLDEDETASSVRLTFEQYQYLDDYRALLLSMIYSDSDTSDDLNRVNAETGLTYSDGTKTYSDGADTTDSDNTYYALLAALKYGTLTINGHTVTPDYLNVIKAYEMETIISVYGEPSYAYIKNGDYDQNGDAEAEWYTNLYERMCEGYMVLEDGLASSAEWIQYALESGLVKLEQVDSDGEWNAITYTSCSDITETTDDTAVTLAEAEYTKAMNKIEAKDKIYDLELKNIDTEHEALQTEYDSIKNAMDKNIERNFKLYS